MKSLKTLAVMSLLAHVVCADKIDSSQTVEWKGDVSDGYYNDPANWVGGILPNSESEKPYGVIRFLDRDVTIKTPPDGLTENSCVLFYGMGSQRHKLTIDTRGTFWEKKGVKAASSWWGASFCSDLNGNHVLNFEDLKTTSNDETVWKFDNAVFTYDGINGGVQNIDLREGTLFFGKPMFLGTSGGKLNFTVHPEARLESVNNALFTHIGNSTTRTVFLGGEHKLNTLSLKSGNANTTPTFLTLTNDAVITASSMYIPNRADGNTTATIDLASSSRLKVSQTFLGHGSTVVTKGPVKSMGVIEVRDDSVFETDKAYIGTSASSTGSVKVINCAQFKINDELYVAGAANQYMNLTNRVGTIALSDDAVMTCGKKIVLANGPKNVAEITLANRAKIVGVENCTITNSADTAGNARISMSGDSVISISGIYGKSSVDGANLVLDIDGGTLTVPDNETVKPVYMSGCLATLGVNGVTIDTKANDFVIDQSFESEDQAATVTIDGNGIVTVLKNSTHPRTIVKSGSAIVFAQGATRFGNEIVLEDKSVVKINNEVSKLEAQSVSFDGYLQIQLCGDLSLDEAHPILSLETPFTEEQLEKLIVVNPSQGKSYQFSLSEGGKNVNVTISTASVNAYTWNGGNGAWGAQGNWNPNGIPTYNDDATFASTANVAVPFNSGVNSVTVQGANEVNLSSDDVFFLGAGALVDAGALLALNIPVKNDSQLTKNGKGTLKFDGNNRTILRGDLILNGGVTEFASADALAFNSESDSALSVSNCTFRYTGGAAAWKRPIKIAGEYCSVFDIVGDLTFDNTKIVYSDAFEEGGGFVKTGAGTLTFNVVAGETKLTQRDADGRHGNNYKGQTGSDVSGTASIVNGEVDSWNGLGQFSILDGTVVIQGNGLSASSVRVNHHASLGGSAWSAGSAPKLHLKDVTFNTGSSAGHHFLVDVNAKQGSPASQLVLENSYFNSDTVYLGHSKERGNTDATKSVLAITNSTLRTSWAFKAPVADGMSPMVRVGRGGVLRCESNSASGGMYFNHLLDVRIEDGGLVEAANQKSIYLDSGSEGDFILANGGGMKTLRLLANSGHPLAVAFDGGSAEFTLNGGISTMTYSHSSSFRADAGGGELRVASGITHFLGASLSGSGLFTKTGDGTLVITNELKWTLSSSLPVYTPVDESCATITNALGVRIEEGVLCCAPGVTCDKSHFSGKGTISGEFDELRVDVNPESGEALMLSDVTANLIVLDFGCKDGNAIANGTECIVAKIAPGKTFGDYVWRCRNYGTGKAVTLTCDVMGNVSAQVKSSGMTIFIR